MFRFRWLIIILLSVTFFCCTEESIEPIYSPPEFMEIPRGFPEVAFPEDNDFSLERWELGKKLFFDPVMSIDSSISCSSCHLPELAFSDDMTFSLGVNNLEGTRNSPSLGNVAYHPYFTREGGVPSLEMQILVPIQEHNEFDFNMVLLAERLAKDSSYIDMANAAYNREPDAFVITRSIATFERSLISGYSKYDQHIHYQNHEHLTEEELRGMDLFFSERTHCSSCHGGFNFTEYSFENNGLYLEYPDMGRFRLTGEEQDLAKFKVPSLRNVELTAPYMHDGSMSSLEEVVHHYNSGGEDHPNKNNLIKPLGLSKNEESELVSFLKTLTDHSFVSNQIFKK